MKKILFLIISMGLVGCASNQKKIEENISELNAKVETQELKIKELNLVIDELIQDVEGLIKKEELDEEDKCECCDDVLSEEDIKKEIEKEDKMNNEEIEKNEEIPAPKPEEDKFSEKKPNTENSLPEPTKLEESVSSQ